MHGQISEAGATCTEIRTDAPWHALRVKAGAERRVCIWMRLRALKPYWPRFPVEATRLQRRDKIIWRSAIPGYLFLPAPVNYRMVEDAPNVYKFLRDGDGDVAIIGQHDMNEIKKIEKSLNASPIAAAEGIPFMVGQRVRVIPFNEVGKIIRIDSRHRLVVEGLFFGGIRALTVSVQHIESV